MKTMPSAHFVLTIVDETQSVHWTSSQETSSCHKIQSQIMSRQAKVAETKMSPDFSPMKKRKKVWGNIVDVYATSVTVLFVAIPTRSDKDEAPWMKPIADAYEADTSGDMAKELRCMAMVDLKGDDDNTVKPKAPGSTVAWEAFVLYKDKDDKDMGDAVALGKNLAEGLTDQVGSLDAYEKKIPFIFGQAMTSKPKALNHFLLEKDVVRFLKRCYTKRTKSELMKDDNIMKAFFGTASRGTKVLGDMTDHGWNRMG